MYRSFWTTAEGDREDPIGHRRRWVLTLVIGGILGFLLSGLWGPGTVLGNRITGDHALADKVHDHLRGGHGWRSLHVVEVDAQGVRETGLGPDSGRWEIGSLTKTFTGLLLADAVDRGEVQLDDPVSRHLPQLGDVPAGSVTLEELATHRSGLPRLLPSESERAALGALLDFDPYRATTTERLIEEVRTADLPTRGEYEYSNVGASLLGHTLAAAAGQPDWPTLVQQRLFVPLGMTDTVIATTPEAIPADAVQGHTPGGRQVGPWVSAGQAPAGCCTWTTPEDLTRYAQALLAGEAPGAAALEPRNDSRGNSRIGLFWQISPAPDNRSMTWHRGETAGATSVLLLDRENHKAVISLSNTAKPVDGLGAGLIADDKTRLPLPDLLDVVAALVLIGFVVWTVRRVRAATWRTQIVGAALDFLTVVLLTARIGTWDAVPGWVHGLALGVGAGALLLGLRRARALPRMSPEPRSDKVQLGLSAVLLVVAAGLMVV